MTRPILCFHEYESVNSQNPRKLSGTVGPKGVDSRGAAWYNESGDCTEEREGWPVFLPRKRKTGKSGQGRKERRLCFFANNTGGSFPCLSGISKAEGAGHGKNGTDFLF